MHSEELVRKNSIHQDHLDRSLIDLLHSDARLGYGELSKRLGTSRITVQRRLSRLIMDKVLNFVVFIDPRRAGAPQGMLFCMELSHRELERTIGKLGRHPNVIRISRTFGLYNAVVLATFRNMEEISVFIRQDLDSISGLMKLDSMMLLQTPVKKGEETSTIDTLDSSIIRLLQTDCRQRNAALAQALKLSPSTIQRRLNRLVNTQTVRFTAVVNESRVDWQHRAAVAIKVYRPQITKVMDRLQKYSEVDFSSYTTGTYNIVISLVCPTQERIYQIVEEEFTRIHGIKECNIMIVLETFYNPAWSGGRLS